MAGDAILFDPLVKALVLYLPTWLKFSFFLLDLARSIRIFISPNGYISRHVDNARFVLSERQAPLREHVHVRFRNVQIQLYGQCIDVRRMSRRSV